MITSYREEGLYYHPITTSVVITLDEEEGCITISFTGLVMKTSNREEGLYDHPITAPVVTTLEEEDYNHFTGQFVNYTSTLQQATIGEHSVIEPDLKPIFEGWLRRKPYDKRDDLTFPIVNIPFMFCNIPAAPAYGVYLSQMM